MDHLSFSTARMALGLSQAQLGVILNVTERTVRRWEANPRTTDNARKVPPTVVRVMEWLQDRWRPPQWPTGGK